MDPGRIYRQRGRFPARGSGSSIAVQPWAVAVRVVNGFAGPVRLPRVPVASREQMGIQQGHHAIQHPMIGFPPPCTRRKEPSDHLSAQEHPGGNRVLVPDGPDVPDEEVALLSKKFLVMSGLWVFYNELNFKIPKNVPVLKRRECPKDEHIRSGSAIFFIKRADIQ